MAGLNDDVDDGLETYLEPQDTNPNAAAAPAITLMNSTGKAVKSDNCPNKVKPSDLFGGPIVPNELPNLDAQFVIVTDTKNRISDNRSIKQSLSSSCSICKEDAKAVDVIAPGFINEERPLGFFTDTKSTLQLKETLNALDVQLEKDIEVLRNAVETVTKELVERFTASTKHMQECLTKLLVGYQPVLAKLVGVVDGSAEDKTALIELLDTLKRSRPRNTDDFISRFPQHANIETLMNLPDFWANTQIVVNSSDIGADKSKWFCFENEDYALQDTEPYLVKCDEKPKDLPNCYLLTVLQNGLSMNTIQYFQNLCQVASNMTSAMATSLTLIHELNTKELPTTKERIDYLTQIAAVNNKYAKQNIALLSFTGGYFDMLDSLFGLVLDMGNTNTAPMINLTQSTPQVGE